MCIVGITCYNKHRVQHAVDSTSGLDKTLDGQSSCTHQSTRNHELLEISMFTQSRSDVFHGLSCSHTSQCHCFVDLIIFH